MMGLISITTDRPNGVFLEPWALDYDSSEILPALLGFVGEKEISQVNLNIVLRDEDVLVEEERSESYIVFEEKTIPKLLETNECVTAIKVTSEIKATVPVTYQGHRKDMLPGDSESFVGRSFIIRFIDGALSIAESK